jgi:drug/metabolite transporter (DMT)-like permease
MSVDRIGHDNVVVGYAQVLAGAGLYGVNALVSKLLLDGGFSPANLAALRCSGTAAVLLVVVGLWRPSLLAIAWRDVPGIVALGLCGAALVEWLYVAAMTEPIVAAAAGWILLHQHLATAQLAGGACVVAGIVLVRRSTSSSRSDNRVL